MGSSGDPAAPNDSGGDGPPAAGGAAPSGTAPLKALVSVGLWTASRGARRQVWHDATEAVAKGQVEVGDGAAKALGKMLPVVLPRFTDGASRRHAALFVAALLDKSGAPAVQALTSGLFDTFGPWRTLAPAPGSAKTAAAALKWTVIIFKHARYGSVL